MKALMMAVLFVAVSLTGQQAMADCRSDCVDEEFDCRRDCNDDDQCIERCRKANYRCSDRCND